MFEWTAGTLEAQNTDKEGLRLTNPAVHNSPIQLAPDKPTDSIKIVGHGKIHAIGFATNHRNVVFGVQLDDGETRWINNATCLRWLKWQPQVGAPLSVEVEVPIDGIPVYNINCFLPFVFYKSFQIWFQYKTYRTGKLEKLKDKLMPEDIYVKWLHIYYLTPTQTPKTIDRSGVPAKVVKKL